MANQNQRNQNQSKQKQASQNQSKQKQANQPQGKKKKSKIWVLLLLIVAVGAYMHFSGNGPAVPGIIPGLGEKDTAESDRIITGIDDLAGSDEYRNSNLEERGQAVEDYLREAASEGSKDSHGNTIVPDSIDRDKGSGSCIYTDSDGGLNVIQYDNTENYTTGSPKGAEKQELQSPPQTKGIVLFGLDEPGSSLADASEDIVDGLCSQGSDCEMDDDVTVSEYEDKLSGYDYVIIDTHGSMLNYGYGFKNESSDIVPVLCTMDSVTSDNLDDYAEDISEQRIAKVYTIDSKDPDTKHHRYWIMPSFFTKYYGDGELDDTYIHLGSCYAYGGDIDVNDGEDTALADAFTECGATAVTGFYNSVFTYYDYDMISEIMKNLLEGNTLSESAEAAREECGEDDEEYAERQGWLSPDSPYRDSAMKKIEKGVAYMIISGDEDMRFGDTQEETEPEEEATEPAEEETKPDQEETETDSSTDVIGYWVDMDKRERLGDELLWDDSVNFNDDGTGSLAMSGGAMRFTYSVGSDGSISITDESGVKYTGKVSGKEIRLYSEKNTLVNDIVFTYDGPPRE